MSSTHHAHAYLRTILPTVKKPAVKGVRSTLSSRTTASHKLASRGNKSKNKPEQDKERGKQNKEVEEEDEGLGEGDQEEMGTSFLQYWYLVTNTADCFRSLTFVPIAPCVRNRSSFPTIRFFTAPRGKDDTTRFGFEASAC